MNTIRAKMLTDSHDDGAPGCVFWNKGDIIKGSIKDGRFYHHYPKVGNWSIPLELVKVVKE